MYPHFSDLQMRYREIDSVTEFQRIWSALNQWFVRETAHSNDRACIDALKTDIRTVDWVKRIIAGSEPQRTDRLSEGYLAAYSRFKADNVLSRFFAAAQRSPVVRARIHHTWRTCSDTRIRPTHVLALTSDQFREVYDAHASALASELGIVHNETLYQTLSALGLRATGCCFAREPQGVATSAMATLTMSELRKSPSLADFVSMVDAATPTTLAADAIETLYNVRNCAVHGSLNASTTEDNEAARRGCDLLDSLVRDILTHW